MAKLAIVLVTHVKHLLLLKSRQKRGCKLDGHRHVSSEFKIFGKYAESAGLQSIICHILNIFIDDQVGILQIV